MTNYSLFMPEAMALAKICKQYIPGIWSQSSSSLCSFRSRFNVRNPFIQNIRPYCVLCPLCYRGALVK